MHRRNTTHSLRSGLARIFLLMLLLPAAQVHAADIELGSHANCGLGSAIRAANTDAVRDGCPAGSGADTIILSGNITRNAAAFPAITSAITIKSPAGESYQISGGDNNHIFTVSSQGSLTLENLTITAGKNAGNGGAIVVSNGSLTLVNSTISDSEASSGGGIYAENSALTLSGSTISGNEATDLSGGGIYATSSSLTIENSVISDNESDAGGGGIAYHAGLSTSRLSISNSTVSGNKATTFGGGLYMHNDNHADASATIKKSAFVDNTAKSGGAISNRKILSLENSTISGNSASDFGGGFHAGWYSASTLKHVTLNDNQGKSEGGGGLFIATITTFNLYNSIIAGSPGGGDCVGALDQNRGNLIQDGSCSPARSGDPKLDALTGSPAYHPLQNDSPAIGAAASAHCLDDDQLGSPRDASACDIGAFESAQTSPPAADETDDRSEPGHPSDPGQTNDPDRANDPGQPDDPDREDDSGRADDPDREDDPDDSGPANPPLETCKTLPENILVSYMHSGVQCQRLDASGIGIQSVIDAGFSEAVDVWGYVEQGVEICFAQPGSLTFLDATTAPRTVSSLPAYSRSGLTCAWLEGPGTVVLVPGPLPPALPQNASPPATIQSLDNCSVTTTDFLNFRDAPYGKLIRVLPMNVTLTALERTDGSFKVDYYGMQGWISAAYVEPIGTCG